jgi:uncharacterized protein YndB with AHSA1/START domain
VTDEKQDPKSPGRSIRKQIEIGAAPDDVWRALTEAEQLIRWFPAEARVSPGVGGTIFISWGPGCEGEAPIHLWEPGHRFGWQEPGPQTLAVEWEIEAKQGRCLVRLVQSGFGDEPSRDDYIDAVDRGWSYFLINLRHYLERHAGTPRDLISVRAPQTRRRSTTWTRLLGGEGFGAQTPAATPTEGGTCQLRLGARSYDAHVLIHQEPWTFAATLPDLDDALLFVEMESGEKQWHCGVWLSTWGLPAPTLTELRGAVAALSSGALA